jgi:two-component system, NarL family, nitrate/nitrite response regulator NarL
MREPGSDAVSRKKRITRDDKSGVSILLIDDNRLFRKGLSTVLKNQTGIRLLGASEKPERVLWLGGGRSPDVVLLDLGLASRAVVASIREAHPRASLIAMGVVPISSEILELVRAGVSGFVLKDASVTDFIASIRAVAAGRRVLPQSLTESLFSQIVEDAGGKGTLKLADVQMTTREREIVDLLERGMSNKEIGKRLSIATDTVKSHVHNILEKLSLRSRVEVAVRGRAPALVGAR